MGVFGDGGENESFLREKNDPDCAAVSDEFMRVNPAEVNFPMTETIMASMETGAWRGAEAFHRVGRTERGAWWWVDPGQGPWVVAGVQGVNRTLGSSPILAQLQGWGFKLLGPDAAEGLMNRGAPFLQALELRRAAGRLIHQNGVQLPDVFDPRWEEAAEQVVNGVMRTASLAGYVSDRNLSWGEASEATHALARPTLLQVCLSLDPAFSAYHAAWEFVLAPRGGEFTRLTADWGVALTNKEALRQMTRDEVGLDTRAYREDLARFTQQFALRYFGGVGRILKAVDPGRLWLSPALYPSTPQVVREMTAQHCDVVQVSEVGLGGGVAPELWVDVDWTRLGREVAVEDPLGVSEMEQMMRRGRQALVGALSQPQVVGYFWGHYGHGDIARDGPFTKGLLDEVGRVNHAHVQVLSAINRQALALRVAAWG